MDFVENDIKELFSDWIMQSKFIDDDVFYSSEYLFQANYA